MPSILLVEDDTLGASTTKLFLESHGHRVSAAESAKEAVALASGRQFDVIITDLTLPDASGEELRRRLGEAGAQAPVIALSGRSPHEGTTFAAFLRKPCLPKRLLDTVARFAGS
jgi:twitching motility two-component system response regulator PilH